MGLSGTPELRCGYDEFHSNAGLAVGAPADVDDAAFLFGLIAHICEEQALAADDDGFHVERAAFFVRVECFGFLVEGLLVRVRAVDEQRDVVRVAQAFATVGILPCWLGRSIDLSAGVLRAQPLALRLPQGLPDAAQRSLPSTAEFCPWANDSSIGRWR